MGKRVEKQWKRQGRHTRSGPRVSSCMIRAWGLGAHRGPVKTEKRHVTCIELRSTLSQNSGMALREVDDEDPALCVDHGVGCWMKCWRTC